jgi:hypothetical protein
MYVRRGERNMRPLRSRRYALARPLGRSTDVVARIVFEAQKAKPGRPVQTAGCYGLCAITIQSACCLGNRRICKQVRPSPLWKSLRQDDDPAAWFSTCLFRCFFSPHPRLFPFVSVLSALNAFKLMFWSAENRVFVLYRPSRLRARWLVVERAARQAMRRRVMHHTPPHFAFRP